MVIYTKGCPRRYCGGDVYIDPDPFGYRMVCLMCSRDIDLALTNGTITKTLQELLIKEYHAKVAEAENYVLDEHVRVLGILDRRASTLESLKFQPGLEEKAVGLTNLLRGLGYINTVLIGESKHFLITDDGGHVLDYYRKLIKTHPELRDYRFLTDDGKLTTFGVHAIEDNKLLPFIRQIRQLQEAKRNNGREAMLESVLT